ncbi:MAG: MFS transporter [Rhizobiales bacterium]|nr:MFS transporter [Hyphomicrobiales bacterium]
MTGEILPHLGSGHRGLTWLGIMRVGLVQASLGSIVVLTTSTLNRVMVVELGLAATIPGALVGLHYGVQLSRPRWGFGSDIGGWRTPWIICGMALLAFGALLAALSTMLIGSSLPAGLALATVSFVIIGVGVGAAGTSLLAMLAVEAAPERRAPAATIVWLMMIAGFIVTAVTAGSLLDPFSLPRLVAVTAGVGATAFLVSVAALHGLERRSVQRSATAAFVPQSTPAAQREPFLPALLEIWAEPKARRFAIFVFVSMLAYSAQDLILEPFAGLAFAMTPGETTKLAGTQHAGVFVGMAIVGLIGGAFGVRDARTLRGWTIGGCLGSALALFGLALAGHAQGDWPLSANVFCLGVANGVFAVSAIGSMMGLAGEGRRAREGTRMGIWGAAQAIAFGIGGLLGTVLVDVVGSFGVAPNAAYAVVFALEAGTFVVAAVLAAHIEAVGVPEQGLVLARNSPGMRSMRE